jgi:hypothetical protein
MIFVNQAPNFLAGRLKRIFHLEFLPRPNAAAP